MGRPVSPEILAVVVSIVLAMVIQTAAFIGALWKMSLRWEHRLTEVETIVGHLPRRHGDVIA